MIINLIIPVFQYGCIPDLQILCILQHGGAAGFGILRIRGDDLDDRRPEGLLLVEDVVPCQVRGDRLDAEILALHARRDVAAVGIGGEVIVVVDAQRTGIALQALSAVPLERVGMEHLGCPVCFVARQTVFAVSVGLRGGIVRVGYIEIDLAVLTGHEILRHEVAALHGLRLFGVVDIVCAREDAGRI